MTDHMRPSFSLPRAGSLAAAAQPIVNVDWTATNASDWLMLRALELRAEAARCAGSGYGFWAYEFEGMAVIAERAAAAELTQHEMTNAPCGTCRGVRVCDITFHRSLS